MLLVKFPRILNRKGRLFYWKFLSLLQFLLTKLPRITSINTELVLENQEIFKLTFSDGQTLYIQSLDRISRYLRGVDYALTRICKIYLNGAKLSIPRQPLGAIFLDVGSNIGEFSLLALKIGYNEIHAIEPDRLAFECLQKNFRLYDKQNRVRCHNIALADKDGKRQFYISSSNADSSLIRPDQIDHKVLVEVVTPVTFVGRNHISKIEFLKIDAEGYEPEILSAFGPILNTVQSFAIDVSEEREGRSTALDVSRILDSQGIAYYSHHFMNNRQIITNYFQSGK